jgi:hypothetical protein
MLATSTVLYVYGTHKIEFNNTTIASKVKVIPLQALTGPEGSRRLRLPDFNTIGT